MSSRCSHMVVSVTRLMRLRTHPHPCLRSSASYSSCRNFNHHAAGLRVPVISPMGEASFRNFSILDQGGTHNRTNINSNSDSSGGVNLDPNTIARRWVSSIDGVKVDVTKTAGNNETIDQNAKESSTCSDSGGGGCEGGGGSSSPDGSGKPKLKKSQQQKAEEELAMLNSHVREHYNHANFSAALEVSQEMLEKCIKLFGTTSTSPHPATASSHNNIGLMHKMMGDFESSRYHYHEALKIYESVVGKDHESYAAALNNLGNLDRTQSMVGTKKRSVPQDGDGHGSEEDMEEEPLTALERMQLNDSAVEYFEEAWNIRKVELGEEHVYTVTSRTNLGGAIASQLLQSEFLRQKKLKEEREKKTDGDQGASDKSDTSDSDDNMTWAVSKYTKERWDAAEEHLRAAYRTSVNSPRGEQVVAPQSSSSAGTIKRRDKALSKKEKKKASKLRKKLEREEKRKAGNMSARNSADNNGLGVGDIKICTLSSAATGQNLAVFLKLRADLISNFASTSHIDEALDSGDMYAEAKNLYLGALRVRTALKGEHHPDTVATKFSLAELIESLGDEKGANDLRQELLDSYKVEEHSDDDATENSS